MTRAADPIGSCPCPVSGCAKRAAVKRFECRATSDAQRRHAGKLYLVCPDHGRLGVDGRSAMQEYILNHQGTTWTSEPAAAEETATPTPKPAPVKAEAPTPEPPKKPAETPKAKGWGLLLE